MEEKMNHWIIVSFWNGEENSKGTSKQLWIVNLYLNVLKTYPTEENVLVTLTVLMTVGITKTFLQLAMFWEHLNTE